MVFDNSDNEREHRQEAASRSGLFIEEADKLLGLKKPALTRYAELAENLPDEDPRHAALDGTVRALRAFEAAIARVEEDRMNPQALRDARQAQANFESQFEILEGYFNATP